MNTKGRSAKALLVLFCISLMTCQPKQQSTSVPQATAAPPKQATAPPVEITSEPEEEGIQDFVFNLTDVDQLPDGGQRLIGKGTHRGTAVELEVDLQPQWERPVGIVEIRSRGAGSDSLLRTMDLLYETQLKPERMAESTRFTAIALQGDPRHLQSGLVDLKLFFESEDEDKSAELYLDIDAGRSRLYLKEKDPDYRKAIIMALTNKVK